MREIPVDGSLKVFCLDASRGSYVYYVESPTAKVLVDACFPKKGPVIWEELGGAPVTDIVITHYDVDHVGSLAWLSQASGATVWLPQADLPYILGQKPRPGIKRLIGALMHTEPPDQYQVIMAGDTVGPLQAVASPGHTPGHLAFEGPGFLCVGDALTTRGGKMGPSPAILAWNPGQAKRTAESLQKTWHGWILPAHGEPILVD